MANVEQSACSVSEQLAREYGDRKKLLDYLIQQCKMITHPVKKNAHDTTEEDIAQFIAGSAAQAEDFFTRINNAKKDTSRFCAQLDAVRGFVFWSYVYYVHGERTDHPFVFLPGTKSRLEYIARVLKINNSEINDALSALLFDDFGTRLMQDPPVYLTGEYTHAELVVRFIEIQNRCKTLLASLLHSGNTGSGGAVSSDKP